MVGRPSRDEDRNESVPLREFFDMRYDAMQHEMDSRFEAAKQAVEKAATLMDRRLDGMNEIRAQLGTQRGEFATAERVEALRTELRTIMDRMDVQSVTERKAIQNSVEILRDIFQRNLDEYKKSREIIDQRYDTAINSLNALYAGLVGRVTGFGGAVAFVLFVVQVITFLILHH